MKGKIYIILAVFFAALFLLVGGRKAAADDEYYGMDNEGPATIYTENGPRVDYVGPNDFHIDTESFLPNAPIDISPDFNFNPMTNPITIAVGNDFIAKMNDSTFTTPNTFANNFNAADMNSPEPAALKIAEPLPTAAVLPASTTELRNLWNEGRIAGMTPAGGRVELDSYSNVKVFSDASSRKPDEIIPLRLLVESGRAEILPKQEAYPHPSDFYLPAAGEALPIVQLSETQTTFINQNGVRETESLRNLWNEGRLSAGIIPQGYEAKLDSYNNVRIYDPSSSKTPAEIIPLRQLLDEGNAVIKNPSMAAPSGSDSVADTTPSYNRDAYNSKLQLLSGGNVPFLPVPKSTESSPVVAPGVNSTAPIQDTAQQQARLEALIRPLPSANALNADSLRPTEVSVSLPDLAKMDPVQISLFNLTPPSLPNTNTSLNDSANNSAGSEPVPAPNAPSYSQSNIDLARVLPNGYSDPSTFTNFPPELRDILRKSDMEAGITTYAPAEPTTTPVIDQKRLEALIQPLPSSNALDPDSLRPTEVAVPLPDLAKIDPVQISFFNSPPPSLPNTDISSPKTVDIQTSKATASEDLKNIPSGRYEIDSTFADGDKHQWHVNLEKNNAGQPTAYMGYMGDNLPVGSISGSLLPGSGGSLTLKNQDTGEIFNVQVNPTEPAAAPVPVTNSMQLPIPTSPQNILLMEKLYPHSVSPETLREANNAPLPTYEKVVANTPAPINWPADSSSTTNTVVATTTNSLPASINANGGTNALDAAMNMTLYTMEAVPITQAPTKDVPNPEPVPEPNWVKGERRIDSTGKEIWYYESNRDTGSKNLVYYNPQTGNYDTLPLSDKYGKPDKSYTLDWGLESAGHGEVKLPNDAIIPLDAARRSEYSVYPVFEKFTVPTGGNNLREIKIPYKDPTSIK